MDLSDNGSECEGISNRSPPLDAVFLHDGTNLKTCVDCGTSKTPLWRGGPAGPKSLCNACGIRSRKKRRALMGVTKEEKKSKKWSTLSPKGHHSVNISSYHSSSTSSSSGGVNGGDSFRLKNRSWGSGSQLGLQKPRSNTNRKRKLGEEEQAAFLLMALSCGPVYG